MELKELENKIDSIGEHLEPLLEGFYGNVQYNIQNGKIINSKYTGCIKHNQPEKQERTN